MADSIESTANWDDPELEDASTKVQVHIYMYINIQVFPRYSLIREWINVHQLVPSWPLIIGQKHI